MKKGIVLCVLLVLFLYGCGGDDLPPEPGEPGTGDREGGVSTAGQAYYHDQEGYAPPYDVFSDEQIFFLDNYVFNVDPGEDWINMGVRAKRDGGYIYRKFFIYQNGEWIDHYFNQDTVSGSNWISGSADSYISLNTNSLGLGENYIVAYSCRKIDNDWKCGCSSPHGRCGQWMLHSFLYRNVDLPPEPIEPGSIYTMRVWLSPRGEILDDSRDVDVYAYFDSRRDDLGGLGETGSLRIITPDGREDSVQIVKQGDVYCDEYDSSFSCHVNYYGTYTPPIEGDYTINFGGVAIPESYKIEEGYFKVDPGIFSRYLILEDIGGFDFMEKWGHYGDYYLSMSARYGGAQYVYANVERNEHGFRFDGWQKITVDDEEIYMNSDSDSHGTWIAYSWLSGDVKVFVDTYSEAGQELVDVLPVVRAYLAKLPPILQPELDHIKVKEAGSNRYRLEFRDGNGNDVLMPLVFAQLDTEIRLGDDDNNLILSEDKSIKKNDYFVVSDYNLPLGKRNTWVLRYKGTDSGSLPSDSQTITFEDLGSGMAMVRIFGSSNTATIN